MGRSRTFGRGAAALTILGATLGSIQLVGDLGRRQVRSELQGSIDARTRQLREILGAHLSALELKAQNGATNPRLVAALSGRVGPETLRDLFQTESWWQPVRESFSHAYVATPDEGAAFISGKKDLGLQSAALVDRALQTRSSTSAVRLAEGWPYAVVAVPVALPSGSLAPVLLLAAPIEAAFVNRAAERIGGAVLVSDRARALLGAGPASETGPLRRAIGRERAAGLLPEPGQDEGAVACVEVAPGVWLLAHVDASGTLARVGAAYAAIRIAVGAVGGALFLILLWWLWRGLRPAAESPLPSEASFAGGGNAASRYVLVNRLGGGGMAEVHLALAVGERGFRRPCVIKRLRPELVANPAAVAQFTDEATLASALVHANIVPIFDFTRVGNEYLLVEEYVVGRDLGRLVRRAATLGKALPPAVVARVGVEALKALDYAHSKRDHDGLPLGIVHRDVSPENIMVTIQGEVQLLDFGVMKVTHGRGGRTEIGELKGNLTFMAPEQARALDVDARADLYSLAAVLFFCLTGAPLTGNDTGYDLLVKAASGPGPDELQKIALLPAPFDTLLAKALSPRREDRFPHAVAFADALAPTAARSAAPLGALVQELFGEELDQERAQLSATSTSLKAMTDTTSPAPTSPVRGGMGR